MIPEERVRRALLNIEKKEISADIEQIEAAIIHLETGGKNNYDAARRSNDRCEDYSQSSEEILLQLKNRLCLRTQQLGSVLAELALLDE